MSLSFFLTRRIFTDRKAAIVSMQYLAGKHRLSTIYGFAKKCEK